MDVDGFQRALGDFPADMAGGRVETLVAPWNTEITRAVDMLLSALSVVELILPCFIPQS